MINVDRACVSLPRLGIAGSLAVYGSGTALLYVATRQVIPLLIERTGFEPVVAWFVAAGVGVFTPLVVIAGLLLAFERRSCSTPLRDRLWLSRMSIGDWRWTLAGAVLIVVLSGPVIALLTRAYGKAAFTPAFLHFEPVAEGRGWLLLAWLPFFALNMLGEAFVWHAVMLPRQVRAFGARAWLVSGSGWALFHSPLPWQILLSLLPTMLVIPYVVQRRANVWIGVVLHVMVNGPGFIAVAFGLV